MKALCAIIAICCSCVIAFASIAVMMAAPSDPPPFIFRANQLLAAMCFLCSLLAIKKPLQATIALWIVVFLYEAVAWQSHIFDESLNLFFWAPVIAAICLSIAAYSERRPLLPN